MSEQWFDNVSVLRAKIEFERGLSSKAGRVFSCRPCRLFLRMNVDANPFSLIELQLIESKLINHVCLW